MLDAAEVLLAQAIERGAVHLSGTAHIVIRARLVALSLGIAPDIGGDVAALLEDFLRIPVLGLALEPTAAFQDQNAPARGCEMMRQGAAAGTAADDDNVIVGFHGLFSR
jgi:hypothetical protein